MAEYVSKDMICAKMMHCNFRSPDMTVSDFINDELPSADVQAVCHGRWKLTNNPSFRKCSECGAWWSSDIADNYFTKYCPKCGARMDGDTNG